MRGGQEAAKNVVHHLYGEEDELRVKDSSKPSQAGFLSLIK